MGGMCEPLSDLSLDFDSAVLQNALLSTQGSLKRICSLEKEGVYAHDTLIDIVDSNIDNIEETLLKYSYTTKGGGDQSDFLLLSSPEQAPQPHPQHDDMRFAELLYGQHTNDQGQGATDESKSTTTPVEFNADFPIIKRIEIVGNWFNKKPRAIIEWNGVEFGRKMSDFKWFWRMLSLNSSIERVVPDYPSDIPESLWPDGYLRRRKRELNLFLMQCHSLPWIKKYKLYKHIFLEQNKKKWKAKRNEFDQQMMKRIKNNQATYEDEE